MPSIRPTSNKTVRDFIIESGVPTRRGDHEILIELTDFGFHDGVDDFTGDHVEMWEPEVARFREVIKSITSIKDLTKIRWNYCASEVYCHPDGMQNPIKPSEQFGPKTLHLKVENYDPRPSNQCNLEIWWDETGAIIYFDNAQCDVELIYYKVD